jgi:hypothetical protein
LLVAAALKGHALLTGWAAPAGVFYSPWFQFGLIEGEVVLGIWLLSGKWEVFAKRLALSCFILFAVVAGERSVSGAVSCGCFGQVRVNPVFVLLFDLTAVVALWRWRPAGCRPLPSHRCVCVWALGLLLLLAVVPAGMAMGRHVPA